MIENAVKSVNQRDNNLLRQFAECGLESIYVDRYHATEDVSTAIRKATRRVWLLGVALNEGLRAATIIEILKAKATEVDNLDIKILVMDPLRSPAIFRMFLESSTTTARHILDFPRPGHQDFDPLFTQTLYANVRGVFDLVTGFPSLLDRVRYYAHDPACWLIVADDVAYYEPYTFGALSGERARRCIGPHFPTFRFRKTDDTFSFELLEDHFHKLWITSDVDSFHFASRIDDREQIAAKIFQQRGEWLKSVYTALDLWHTKRNERRSCPRLPCESSPKPQVSMQWNVGSDRRSCKGKVIDFSRKGLAIELTSAPT